MYLLVFETVRSYLMKSMIWNTNENKIKLDPRTSQFRKLINILYRYKLRNHINLTIKLTINLY